MYRLSRVIDEVYAVRDARHPGYLWLVCRRTGLTMRVIMLSGA